MNVHTCVCTYNPPTGARPLHTNTQIGDQEVEKERGREGGRERISAILTTRKLSPSFLKCSLEKSLPKSVNVIEISLVLRRHLPMASVPPPEAQTTNRDPDAPVRGRTGHWLSVLKRQHRVLSTGKRQSLPTRGDQMLSLTNRNSLLLQKHTAFILDL